MASRVGVDVITTSQRPSAQGNDSWTSCHDIVHHDVQVELLRPVWVWPLRWLMVRRELEGDAGCGVVLGDHDPFIGAVSNR